MVMKEMGYNKLKQTELQLEESTKKAVERGSKKKAQREAESVILKSSIRTWNFSVTDLEPI